MAPPIKTYGHKNPIFFISFLTILCLQVFPYVKCNLHLLFLKRSTGKRKEEQIHFIASPTKEIKILSNQYSAFKLVAGAASVDADGQAPVSDLKAMPIYGRTSEMIWLDCL
jgi:hypothetical protein